MGDSSASREAVVSLYAADTGATLSRGNLSWTPRADHGSCIIGLPAARGCGPERVAIAQGATVAVLTPRYD